MAKAEASVEELVSKIERGELRLPEMQRREASYGSTSGLTLLQAWGPPCAPSTFTRPKPSSPG